MGRTPIHPGEILKDELAEMGMNAAELARQLRVPENRISEVIRGRRNITADTAPRLGEWFGNSAVFWMNLRKSHELRKAQRDVGSEIDSDTNPGCIRPRSGSLAIGWINGLGSLGGHMVSDPLRLGQLMVIGTVIHLTQDRTAESGTDEALRLGNNCYSFAV